MVGKEWRGIQTNLCIFQGPIEGDPVQSGEYWFMTLLTKTTTKDANGQYVELEQKIPLMVEPDGPQGVMSHIKDKRQLQATCAWKTWIGDGDANANYAFAVKHIDLGHKPYDGPKKDDIPDLPQ